MRNLLRCTGCLFLGLLLLGAAPPRQPTTYQPPIGIPAPSFGIEEIAPAAPAAWPGAAALGYYYIDNSHPNATDTNNEYGYPNRPRQSIPEIAYPAGSYVEIHGGDYTDANIRIDFNCTRAQPCWMRGTPGNMPKISGTCVSTVNLTYVIFEYLDFEGGSDTSIAAVAGNHIALRHSVVHNKSWNGNSAGVGIGPTVGTTVHDVVVYKTLFHDLGDWQVTTDQDFHAVAPGLWGLDETSGAEMYNYWILENTCYHISGDCVQVNAGWGQGASNYLHHIYIGKNRSYQNRQTGFWSKQARDVIISQNVAYGGREHGDSGGGGIGYQYNPDNLWILYNELYDNNFGIIQGSTDGDPSHTVYIIGNLIRDNEQNLDPCGHWSSPNGWAISLWYGSTKYIVNNTIYNTRGGIELINGGDGAPTFVSTNIIANLNGMDYVNESPACGDFTVAPGKVEHLSTNAVTSVTIDHNLFAQADGQPIRLNGFPSLAAYQAGSGQCANCRVGDPLFVNAAQGDFRLQTGSPALDAGIAHEVYQRFFDLYGLDIRVDYRNQPRPQGQGWDLGAHEGNTLATTATPGVTPIASATPATLTTPTPTATSVPAHTPTPIQTPPPVQAAVCGNGIIEAAEACDDSNTVSGDGCTDQCAIEESCYDPGNTFSFFTWSDSYGSAGDGGATRLFRDAVNRTLYPNRVLPRFWISPGDIPYVPGIEQFSIKDLNAELSGNNYPFTCSVSNREFPLFVALGNHDVDGDATQIAAKLAYWSNQIGPQVDKTLVGIQNFQWGPDNGYDARTTYSFDYKNTHFVVYNQYDGDPGYPTPDPVACVRPTLYNWIDQDLTATTRPIKLVIGHEPAWSFCSNAPGYNGCINYGNNFIEDLLDPNERPRPHSTSGQAWVEAYGKHWGDSLEDAQCPTINGQEGRSAFWQMLATHKVVAHMVGHTHTYSSRLVDADGPRNDAPMTQAERNRMAYGKNGDIFTNAAGIWEVDSAQAHNSAGSVYVLVTVRDNRVTFEAWDQMGAGEEEEPFRLVESWHVDVEGAAPVPDTTPPTVAITSPSDGAPVAGLITLAATATDNVGIASVQFFIDGANFGDPDTTSPYSIDLDTTTLTAGSHTISATVRDAAGNTATAASLIIMVVKNQLFLPTLQR
ncbi:MAG: Ig-like domain-containing protein [Caldilineaceae bacterium]